MAASSRLPVALLGSAVLILAVLIWKPWSSPRPSAPADAAGDAALGAAPQAQGAEAAQIGQAPQLTAQQQQAAVAETVRSAAPAAQPPQSYKGPDGKQHEIVYNQGLALSPGAREELKRQRLQQMRDQPEAISKIYGIGRDEIAAVLAGKRPFPDRLIDQ
ncbi:hypothetical protein [Lysobacter enzymogenes]|uniref:Helix-hairpin-helix domain-containing protein n=1 Tax=Lysobacter enzymogenes TaxID=69 RepID=A0AAU9B9Q8_LYSEN|nr:hypothetical protein [Lysobacter enzymogenes]BAV99836.1 hypothetical protein LEN_4349 [Lysobacter enzymogenes]